MTLDLTTVSGSDSLLSFVSDLAGDLASFVYPFLGRLTRCASSMASASIIPALIRD